MIRTMLALLAALPAATLAAAPAELPPGLTGRIETRAIPEPLTLDALDVSALIAEDIQREARGAVPRYAVIKDIAPVTPATAGTWQRLKDGSRVWRYRVRAKSATSVELGFGRFHLPEGAALYVYGNNGKRVRGPFTAEDNEAHGELWVPIVEGESATIELVLQPEVERAQVQLKLTRVGQGYWEFWKLGAAKSGACNVDVACDAANGWEDQIQSVARITVGGSLCSGQMVANTAGTNRPLFLTAAHCRMSEQSARAMTVYWNFESPVCREPGSVESGRPSGDDPLDQAQSGAELLAIYAPSDFALVELDDMPEPGFEVYWTGWDRRDMIFDGGIGIHHPAGHEKRISFEYDPLGIIDGGRINELTQPDPILAQARPRSHLEVKDWDLGVTEGGSSGSGLWNPAHRLVGQLTGGQVLECENEPDFDWYGRLSMSWTGGGTPDSSLRPWLDPAGTGEKFIDGYYACGLPEAFGIDISPGNLKAGETVTLRAIVPNGVSAEDFTYAWDVDGDGLTDGTGRVLETRYGDGVAGQVILRVQEKGAACVAAFNKPVEVGAPDLILMETGTPAEVNGDGDGDIEPGERWRLPVTLKNTGTVRAQDVKAVFTRAGVTESEQSSGGPDQFGYEFADSRTSIACPFQFVDITAQANRIPFSRDAPNSGAPPRDDGATEAVPLMDFRFYERQVNAVVMSSNGYLTTSAASNGGDYTNECPLPFPPGSDVGGARLAAFHDDLITGDAYTAFFNDCPRPPDADHSTGACTVFQWHDVGLIGGPPAYAELDVPHFDFQALLYEGSNEVVYQFGAATPQSAASATVGIQNDPADIGLTYSCQALPRAVPAPQSAVCFFHPQGKASAAATDGLHLETPALPFDNIPIGADRTASLEFSVDAGAACGDVVGIHLEGTLFDGGFSAGPGLIFKTRLGGDQAVCDANAKAASGKANIAFPGGLWFNRDRNGHGADVSLAQNGTVGVITWYTYDASRSPVWYQAVGPYRDNQIHADLLRYTWNGSKATPEDVGEVVFTVLDKDSAVFTWTLRGEKGGEPFTPLIFDDQPPPANHSGLWYPPDQPGWGMTFSDQGQIETGILYFYDAAGAPIWSLGVKTQAGADTLTMQQFTGTCPGCPWVKQTAVDAGTLTRRFSGPRTGTVSTDLTLKGAREGNWNKNQVPIEILTDPRG